MCGGIQKLVVFHFENSENMPHYINFTLNFNTRHTKILVRKDYHYWLLLLLLLLVIAHAM